ncbi:MAG: RluA family pseudouridine synthase [Oscillospiraceae bacterium]|nr:RluA family pseudouridine synthase [Oscillospiraceae bacterium]
MSRLEFTVEDTSGARIDKWISERNSDISRSMLQKLMVEQKITVNGKFAAKSYLVKAGDIIEIDVPEPVELDVVPENIPVEIVYQDEHLLVVNKPKGMVVHPAAGNYSGTLVNALLYHCKGQLSSINGVIRPGIVHRIDKNTSGLLIVAKTDKAHVGLAEQIKEHTFTREYHAIVCGRLKNPTGIIEAPIGRHHVDRKKMCVTEKNSKEAKTEYTVLEEFNNYSYVKLKLFTGRTHQIRVHMSYIGHPVFGDDVYGKSSKYCEGQCLHAKKIGFVHPIDGKYYEFDSELPDYFKFVLNKLSK